METRKILTILVLALALDLTVLPAKAGAAVLRRLPKAHCPQNMDRKEQKKLNDAEPLVSGCLTPPNYNKTITPSPTWQTDCEYISSSSCCIYRMYLRADRVYDFSLCANDCVGGSCDNDGDMQMFGSSGTSQWGIDYGPNCASIGDNWAASTLGSLYEAWSPPSDGYYYLKVSEYNNSSMNYCLAYSQTRHYDNYIQADSHPDNTVELVFAFAFPSNPGRVYFSASPACGTVTPSYDDPTLGGGYYWVSTEYNPCETECSYVTVTADPTFGQNQTRTIHLDDRSHILCCEDTNLGVTTHNADTGECEQAYVTVTVIPPECGIVSPASGNSYWDPNYQCYVFLSTFTPNCSCEGRVCVKFHTSGNDVIYSYDINPAITPSDSWQTVSDSFCTEGFDRNYRQVYKMYLSANERYNFTVCENDSVGASCDGDGDLKMFDSSCTSPWYVDGASDCDYHASTLGTDHQDWSPPSSGYYYLEVSEYWSCPMSYTLAYIKVPPTCWDPAECPGQPYGDATCDGRVNLADLYALKAAYGMNAPYTPPYCCADFNHDGSADLSDVNDVLRAYFGTEGYTPSTGNQTCP